jgi:hypothetical protein
MPEERKKLRDITLDENEKWVRLASNPLILLAGDLGLEPRTFGSGDQRSILLS